MVKEMKKKLEILASMLCALLAPASTTLAATVTPENLSASIGGETIPV